MKITRAVGYRIADLLALKNWSLYRLAKESGLDYSLLAQIMDERNKDVRLSKIVAICNAFGISVNEFFDEATCKRLAEQENL